MHPEGELWVRSIKVRVMGEHDEPIGILGISEDISERKRTEEALRKAHEELELRVAERTRELTSANRTLAAQIAARQKVEEALRESEEKYRTLVESSPEAIFVQTGGCFAFLNSAAVRLFGLKSADRLLGRPVIEVFHPEDRSRIAERIRILNEQKIPVPNLEERCLRPDGTHVEVEVSAVPLQYDRQDGALVFAREIRERKRAERALKESETRFRSVFDNTSVPIALVDLTGHILLVNEAFEQFLAYGRGELKGVHYSRITHPEDLEADEEKLEALLKSGAGHYQMDKRYLSRSGRVVWGRLTVSLVSDPQKGPQYLVGICEDITERKALEIHASRVRHLTSIGELAAGVAHEINNPINGIINYAQIMLDTEDDPDMRAQLLPKVIQEGERIAGIVKKLLSFARATHNDKQPVRVEPILADSIALMAARFRKDGIRITLDIADSLPPILANRQEIEQVFLNLLSNARYSLNEKFPEMDDRKRIEIRAARVDPSQGDRVRVSILDSGTGIPRPVLDRIFDPFYSTKPPDEGAGLGLSISYGIVAEHAGRIYFESEPGHCTQAIVELPAAVETTAGD
jgi:PAS domain S-box-containing protein